MHETSPLTNNESARRFEVTVDGKPAFINYQKQGDKTLILTHTEVDPTLEGKGVGSKLVADTLAYIDSRGMNIVSACPFVSVYIKRHPDWQRLLVEDLAED
ncbi:GNAT family N-acetyltransferase [Spirosoma rhododendri]|uniref:N-acetyltransferase n=1 Tax=Spirosoma rhododendri TaxID=2728024 RepID=A0A7L5DNN8_9BACT|nr:GNAT family N-acetyltransferase [Spirosoma rhododendri]QJD80079.1 N-acetyltransferase [Spirosoma rhododendri]